MNRPDRTADRGERDHAVNRPRVPVHQGRCRLAAGWRSGPTKNSRDDQVAEREPVRAVSHPRVMGVGLFEIFLPHGEQARRPGRRARPVTGACSDAGKPVSSRSSSRRGNAVTPLSTRPRHEQAQRRLRKRRIGTRAGRSLRSGTSCANGVCPSDDRPGDATRLMPPSSYVVSAGSEITSTGGGAKALPRRPWLSSPFAPGRLPSSACRKRRH